MSDRRAEQRHHAIPGVLVDAALEAVDLGRDYLETPRDELMHLLGIATFGERAEAGDVGEQHGHLTSLAGEGRARPEDLLDEMFRRVRPWSESSARHRSVRWRVVRSGAYGITRRRGNPHDSLATLGAEPGGRREPCATARTALHEARAAFEAEPRVRRVRVAAFGRGHRRPAVYSRAVVVRRADVSSPGVRPFTASHSTRARGSAGLRPVTRSGAWTSWRTSSPTRDASAR